MPKLQQYLFVSSKPKELLTTFYVFEDMKVDVINIDPEILSGTPVFRGTRVPIETLFDHLESGITIDAFLDDFPSVSREQVTQVLELVGQLFSSEKIKQIYEIASCGSPPG
jgi:uncharacterized protein (DUF433 family)